MLKVFNKWSTLLQLNDLMFIATSVTEDTIHDIYCMLRELTRKGNTLASLLNLVSESPIKLSNGSVYQNFLNNTTTTTLETVYHTSDADRKILQENNSLLSLHRSIVDQRLPAGIEHHALFVDMTVRQAKMYHDIVKKKATQWIMQLN